MRYAQEGILCRRNLVSANFSLGPHGFHQVAYTEWGDQHNDRIVVCVHGLNRNSRDFDALATRLADRFRIVCMDVVGRGSSDWLRHKGDYGFPLYLSDAAARGHSSDPGAAEDQRRPRGANHRDRISAPLLVARRRRACNPPTTDAISVGGASGSREHRTFKAPPPPAGGVSAFLRWSSAAPREARRTAPSLVLS